MLDRFRWILVPPVFPEDDELTRVAHVLNALLILVVLAAVSMGLATATVFVAKMANYVFILILLGLAFLTLGLMHRKKVRLAGLVLVGGLWVFFVVGVFASGGPYSALVSFLLLPTVLAGLVLGEKSAIYISILSSLACLAMVLWNVSGHSLPSVFPVPLSLISGWIDLTVGLLVITVAINIAVHSYQQAIQAVHEQLAERKKVEMALRASERKFSEIARNIPGMVFQVQQSSDGTLRFNYASPRGLQDMELPENFAETWKLGDLVPEVDRNAYPENIWKAIDRRSEWQVETRRIIRDGQVRWFLGTALPSMEGDTLLYNGVMLDITERKRAEAEVARLNQALQIRVEERTHELSTLSRVMTLSIQALSFDVLAETVLEAVLETSRYQAGMIHLYPENGPDEKTSPTPALRLTASQGLPAGLIIHYQLLLPEDELVGQAARLGKALVINFPADFTQDQDFLAPFQSYIGTPIFIRGELIGVLSIFSLSTQEIGSESSLFLHTIADILGGAIDNINLHRRVEQAVILEERQRLARDLHDSVSQILFSASALAETLPLVWQTDPIKGKEYMSSLSRLTRAALAEMRSLLMELRPQALLNTDLGELIRQLAHSFAGHTQAEVDLRVNGKAVLAANVQTMFFRIAQETLHNIIKHARANRVSVQFDLKPDYAWLRIEDNGCGFDLNQLSSQCFGLRIMQERAAVVGALLDIDSQPGHGTLVSLRWDQTLSSLYLV